MAADDPVANEAVAGLVLMTFMKPICVLIMEQLRFVIAAEGYFIDVVTYDGTRSVLRARALHPMRHPTTIEPPKPVKIHIDIHYAPTNIAGVVAIRGPGGEFIPPRRN